MPKLLAIFAIGYGWAVALAFSTDLGGTRPTVVGLSKPASQPRDGLRRGPQASQRDSVYSYLDPRIGRVIVDGHGLSATDNCHLNSTAKALTCDQIWEK